MYARGVWQGGVVELSTDEDGPQHARFPCGWRRAARHAWKEYEDLPGRALCSFARALSVNDEAIVVPSFAAPVGTLSVQDLRSTAPFGSLASPFQHEVICSWLSVAGTHRGPEYEHLSPLIVMQRNAGVLEQFFLGADSVFAPTSVGPLCPEDFLVVLDGEIVMSCVAHHRSVVVLASMAHALDER